MPKNIDIVTAANQPTGSQLSIDSALKQGLWHRGIHIIVYTETGYVLLQKRSSKLLMHPGYLDMSCGGFVDSGESPERAALRELHEELGIISKATDLQFITIYRQNHAWPRLHGHSRAFIYCYAICLPDHHIDISHLQKSEVAWAGFVSHAQARRMVRLHHLKGLGRLEPLYGFYKQLLQVTTRRSPQTNDR